MAVDLDVRYALQGFVITTDGSAQLKNIIVVEASIAGEDEYSTEKAGGLHKDIMLPGQEIVDLFAGAGTAGEKASEYKNKLAKYRTAQAEPNVGWSEGDIELHYNNNLLSQAAYNAVEDFLVNTLHREMPSKENPLYLTY